MKKVGIIGVGKWGGIILSKLNLISNVEIKFVNIRRNSSGEGGYLVYY